MWKWPLDEHNSEAHASSHCPKFVPRRLLDCCSLNENDSHRLACLSAWSLVSGPLWEGRKCDLVGGDVSVGVDLRFQKTLPGPVSLS